MEIQALFIAGAGFMGSGIAQVAAVAGLEVILYDLSPDILAKSIEGIKKMLAKQRDKGKLPENEMRAALSRIKGTQDLEDAAQADAVIEAIAENAAAKKELFAALSPICRENALLASNTSSISITDLARAVKHPERFVGMHFFSPVPLMKLLEVVKGLVTSGETVDAAVALGQTLGKYCIVAKDSPAFLVNRIIDPMGNEAANLLEAGIGSVTDIDMGLRYGCNHPMGPFELMDMAGIDVELAAMEVLYAETGDSKYRPSTLLKNMVRAGYLGRKTGIGFYVYHPDGSKTPNPIFDGG